MSGTLENLYVMRIIFNNDKFHILILSLDFHRKLEI